MDRGGSAGDSPCGHCRRLVHARPAIFPASTFLPPFPRRGFTIPRLTMASGSQLNRLSATCGTTKALTPAIGHRQRQASPLISRQLPNVPPPTTRCAPVSLYTPTQRTGRVSDFALNEQARRHTPPNRVRHPADRQFASGCSPPRLAATQLPSATGLWLTPTRTSTVLLSRLHGRTRPSVGWNPVHR